MPEGTAEASQRVAARIAGFTLLLLMISGLTGMFIFDRHLVVAGDAAATARNILAHEQGFRAGQVCGILMLNCDVVLALALYGLLKPVNSTLALLGSFWRIANALVLGVGVASSLVGIDLLSNPHEMSLLSLGQMHALTLIFFDLGSRLSLMGLMFFCLGCGYSQLVVVPVALYSKSNIGPLSVLLHRNVVVLLPFYPLPEHESRS